MPQLLSGDPEVLATEAGKKWYGELTSGNEDRIFKTAMEIVGSLSGDVPPIKNDKAVRNAWQAYTALADKYNDPGQFTAIIGFEWTAIGGFNLHRNVLFRGDSTRRQPHLAVLAVRQQESGRPVAAPGRAREADGRGSAGHPAQRQPEQRPHVLRRDLRRQAAHQGTRGAARQIRAAHRSHADQGRRRVASVPVAERRVRRLREVGPVQPQRHRGEEARDAAVRVRARGAEERPRAGAQARREPVQVRHGRQHRLAHLAVGGRGGQLLRQALRRRARPAPLGAHRHRGARSQVQHLRLDAGRRRVTRASGRPRTRAKRSSTR